MTFSSASSSSSTPQNVGIHPRNYNFDLEAALSTDWHGGDPFKTAFFNALSMMFPIGEKAFMDSVKAFKDHVTDSKLQEDVKGFLSQEAIHSREHRKYNERLCELRGYDLEAMEGPIRKRIAWADKNLPPIARLYGTVAYEHYTAIMANGALSNPQWLNGAHPAMVALWRWHAIEETEHKAVAFDVLQLAGATVKERRMSMIFVTRYFVGDAIRNINHMLKRDGYSFWQRLKLWRSGLSFLLGREGILRPLVREWTDYFRRDFHPWQHDNRKLLEEVKETVGPEPQLA